MRINNNIMAFNAQRNLGASASSMGKAIEKLSSGLRINRAADDASGLVISQKLRAQTSGLRQATRNAQDGISVVQTAEGGMNEVHSMLNRMRDLAVQAANTGANDATSRAAAQDELDALVTEIDRIGDTTSFGGSKLLNGSFGVTAAHASGYNATGTYTVAATNDTFTISVTGGGGPQTVTLDQAGYTAANFATEVETKIKAALNNSGDAVDRAAADNVSVVTADAGAGSTFEIRLGGQTAGQTFTLGANGENFLTDFNVGAVTAAAGGGGDFQVGADAGGKNVITVAINKVDAATLGINGLNLNTGAGAGAAITAIDGAIADMSEARGELGAVQNRLESTISNLQVTSENLAASESRIRDTDVAAEMVEFTRSQILQQAGTAMLGQANANSSSALRLLG